ncbi:MAG TPA: O-antigen ligase domain-containing protein, partial [Gammaproteobacteria bacterium]|nr:O-antigen ligase domain-containing protein [Gammaproteobacteria bacterium]
MFQFHRLIQLTLGLYLLLNVYINSSILLTSNRNFLFPLFCILLFSLVAVRKKHFFFFLLFVFGTTFFLFGFRSYDVQSRFFELEVAVLSFILLVKDRNALKYHLENKVVALLLLLYCCLALCSLLLLPLQDIFAKIRLWGIHDFAFFALNATPELPEYSIAAVNRLLLFSLTAGLLAYSGTCAEKYFHYIFKGAVSGMVIAAIIGLLEYFNVLSLSWYVPGSLNKLHSLFLNRGWYAEYVLTLAPLLFLGVCHRSERRRLYVPIIFVALFIVGTSILFTGARSGWGLFTVLLAGSSFVFVGQGSLRQKMFKSLLFFFMAVVLLFIVSFSIFKITQMQDGPGVRLPKSMSAKQVFLEKRLNNLFRTGRIKNWQDTVHLIDGRFLFGRGYESFSRQAHILAGIPTSGYKRSQQHQKIRDTAHNFYLQLVVGNG